MFFCEMPGTLSHPYLSAEGKKKCMLEGDVLEVIKVH